MAPRAYWKGYLKLSLVSCAVAMYPAASTSSRITFNTINKKTGNRVRQHLVDAETGEPVESDDRVKGYEVAKGDYVIVDDEDLDRIALESTHTIDIESFVPRAEVDERYLDAPYYLAPDDRVAQEAFAVIREAMRAKEVVGLGRVVLHRRERILMLEPLDKGLLATALRYGTEIRDFRPYFEDIPDLKIPAEMTDLATHIIATKAGHFDPARFEDRYEQALVELVRSKQAGARPAAPAQAEPPRVVNLLEALRRSVAAESGSRSPSVQPAPANDTGPPPKKTPRPAAAGGAKKAPTRAPAKLKKAG